MPFPTDSSSLYFNEILQHRAAFLECMDDDFNTGGAIGFLYEMLNSLNRWAGAEHLEDAKKEDVRLEGFRRGVVVLKELSNILGVFRPEKATGSSGESDKLLNDVMALLIDLRADARKQKNFALADQIRQGLTKIGVTLEDRPGGSGWRRG